MSQVLPSTAASKRQRLLRTAVWVALAALAMSAFVGVVTVLVGRFDDTTRRVLATAAALAGASVMALPSFAHLERGRYQALALPGLAATVLAYLMLLPLIWGGGDVESAPLWKSVGTLVVIAFAANHVGLLLLLTQAKDRLVRGSLAATLCIVAVVALLLVTAIWTEQDSNQYWRAVAALGILDVLGTVAVPILSWAASRRGPAQP